MALFVSQAMAQKYKVAGVIKDEEGKRLSGVLIQEIGTNANATTDKNGIYEMRVHYGNATLLVTAEGYFKVKKDIQGIGTQNFILTSLAKKMQTGIVGSRNPANTIADLSSPVDIIDIQKIAGLNGQFDLPQLLQYVSGSFNSNRQLGADGADLIDASSIHGMGPDQMLVLVNGKRRHQSSLINLSGTRGRGNTGFDFNTIPVSSVDRIEIMRDGAVAQYGSDAVSGVINIVLKNNTDGFSANANGGIRMAKYSRDSSSWDGLSYNVNINYGTKIAKTGFFNITADYNFQDHTNRAATQVDSIVRRKFGDPKIYNGSLGYNMAIPVYKNTEVYSFGTASYRQGETYSWTRGARDSTNFIRLNPNGFDPLVSRVVDDRSVTLGVRTRWDRFNIDLSHTYGFNKFSYDVRSSLNKSFGIDTTRSSFEAGGFQTAQNITSLEVSTFYDDILDGVHLAFGGAYQTDNYKINVGNPLSWRTYNPLKFGGAQGFKGYGATEAIDQKRYNAAGYVDVEAKFDESFSVNAAGRFDFYSDLGSAVSGKAGLRYKITNTITVRGAYGLGFRAPSLAQQHYSYDILIPSKANLEYPQSNIITRSGSEISKAIGVPDLKMEISHNGSAGIVFAPDKSFSVSVDGYFVRVQDRAILTGAFDANDKQIGAVLKRLNVAQVRFFTNSLTTTTAGVDLSMKFTADLGAGKFNAILSANYNTMSIDTVKTSERLANKQDSYLDKRERYFILASAPPMMINLMLDYTAGPLTFMIRGTYFDEIQLINRNFGGRDKNGRPYTEASYTDTYKAMIQADATIGIKVNEKFSLAVGGSNLLNAYPTMSRPNRTESGGAWDSVQAGNNGSFFFTKLYYKF